MKSFLSIHTDAMTVLMKNAKGKLNLHISLKFNILILVFIFALVRINIPPLKLPDRGFSVKYTNKQANPF